MANNGVGMECPEEFETHNPSKSSNRNHWPQGQQIISTHSTLRTSQHLSNQHTRSQHQSTQNLNTSTSTTTHQRWYPASRTFPVPTSSQNFPEHGGNPSVATIPDNLNFTTFPSTNLSTLLNIDTTLSSSRRNPATRHVPVPAASQNEQSNFENHVAVAGTGSLTQSQASTPCSSNENISAVSLSNPPDKIPNLRSNVSHKSSSTFALQWNICGLRTHRSELQLLLTELQPTIVCLQETNLFEHNTPSNFLGQKYHLLLGPCSTHGRQGAGLVVKDGIPFERLNISTDIQAVAIRLHAPIEVTAVSVYLPPSMESAAYNLGKLLEELPKPLLVLGDLNAHHTAWGSSFTNASSQSRKRGNEILQHVVDNDMLVLNNGLHTRIDPASGKSQALDITICSTAISSKFIWRVHTDLADSDHFPTMVDIITASNNITHRKKWLYEKGDWNRYEQLSRECMKADEILSVSEFT